MIRRTEGRVSSVESRTKVERFSLPKPPAPEPKTVRPAVDHTRDTFTRGNTGAGAGTSAGVGAATGAGVAGKTNSLRDEFQASDGFKQLSAADQEKALEVFDAMDAAGQRNLMNLTNRQVIQITDTTCGEGTALMDKDTTGRTLLDNLHQMATQPMPQSFAEAGVSRENLLSTVCQEAADPGQINQSDRGTCTVTSMQYMLNSENPAEYVRLMAGLASESGEVKLANGDTLRRDADSIAMDSATARSCSERLFQAAMMQYARGGDESDYSNVTHKDEGLDAGEQERALEGLFNKGFDDYDGTFLNLTPGNEDVLNRLKERSPEDSYIRMHWGEDKSGGHAVVVDRVEDGRVYFRNPHGPGGTQGEQLEDPPRIVEDPNTGMQSMSEEDFLKWVKSTIVPS